MAKKPQIDKGGKAAVIVCVRFSENIVELLDLLTENRSKFVREATYDKISKEMEGK
jgi:hypothetical protein